MGWGAWSDNTYTAAKTFRKASGIADFAHDASTRSKPRSDWAADPSLEPKGVQFRESRDSAEHPESTPIIVLFDVTGSMGGVPRTMQERLPELLGLIQRNGYVTDPQIMFGAIGDADSDQVPLQVGQFESDNAMDEQLRLIFLEGYGGGQMSESYELATYFVARHTVTDAWEKRGKKGYLFIIGDETNKSRLKARHIADVIGEEASEDLAVDAIYREVQERWETFFILPNQTNHFDNPQVNKHWHDLLGERLLRLEDPDAVCDLIALTVGLLEDSIDLDEGLDHLKQIGSGHGGAVSRALATVGAGRGGAVTTSTLPSGLDGQDDLA